MSTAGGPGADTTISLESSDAPQRARPIPGAVLIFADQQPAARVFRVGPEPLELGRLELSVGPTSDARISRRHIGICQEGAAFRVSDLGSRNGTFLNGEPVSGETCAPPGSILRVGGALLLLSADILRFDHYGLGDRDGRIVGPALRVALEAISLARRSGVLTSLLISGESGTGKELAAQVFHEAGGRAERPFVAVNCATIPKDLAERLLFGSRRGAFSGATDAIGHVQAAAGGTLFLDEIAELPLDVQSKLLRMLETREVLRLGDTRAETVDTRVCAATWRNLREAVAAGRFREDLYFRIGQPEIRLPALRERPEEIPWHIAHVLDELCRDGAPRLTASAAWVEGCALRHWPGNVRELRAEVRRAAATALARQANVLLGDDLDANAGRPLAQPVQPAQPVADNTLPEDEFAAALALESGNVTGAARRLGVHRNKVRRWLERYQVDVRRFK